MTVTVMESPAKAMPAIKRPRDVQVLLPGLRFRLVRDSMRRMLLLLCY